MTHSRYIHIIATASFAVCLLVSALPLSAEAFFSGDSGANANTMTLGTLSFTTNVTTLSGTVASTSTTTLPFTTTDTGSIAPNYTFSVQKGTCSDGFYSGLAVQLTQPSATSSYEGTLPSFSAVSTSTGAWQLNISAGHAVAWLGDTCQFDLHIKASQPEFPVYGSGGFTDEKTLAVTLTAGDNLGRNIVLNEVLPNPDTVTVGAVPAEFIELYNLTGSPIDVAGWQISEMTGSGHEVFHTIVVTGSSAGELQQYGGGGSAIVPAHGWLALEFYGGSSYLNNGGDTVSLYDTTNTLHDAYTYTSSTVGKSDARSPDGVGAWVDPVPTPGAPNELSAPAPIVEKVVEDVSVATTSVATSTEEVSNQGGDDSDKKQDNQQTDQQNQDAPAKKEDDAPGDQMLEATSTIPTTGETFTDATSTPQTSGGQGDSPDDTNAPADTQEDGGQVNDEADNSANQQSGESTSGEEKGQEQSDSPANTEASQESTE